MKFIIIYCFVSYLLVTSLLKLVDYSNQSIMYLLVKVKPCNIWELCLATDDLSHMVINRILDYLKYR